MEKNWNFNSDDVLAEVDLWDHDLNHPISDFD